MSRPCPLTVHVGLVGAAKCGLEHAHLGACSPTLFLARHARASGEQRIDAWGA